jgi:hypothetical protein
MRSKLGVSVALGVTVLLAFGAPLAAADGKGKRTLRLVAVENQTDFVDVGAPGPSLGDELVISEILRQRGREVGDIVVFQCVATLSLRRHGQITLQGLIEVQGEEDPGPFKVAITGGTRDFAGAGGDATVRDVAPGRSVYRLRFDSGKKKHHRG